MLKVSHSVAALTVFYCLLSSGIQAFAVNGITEMTHIKSVYFLTYVVLVSWLSASHANSCPSTE